MSKASKNRPNKTTAAIQSMMRYNGENRSHPPFTDKVEEILRLVVGLCEWNLRWQLRRCESPIEQLMNLALWYYFDHSQSVSYCPQYEIDVEDKTYRADFYVRATNYKGEILQVVVECDGHDFHERTKEQAARDRFRDRGLTKAGYVVFRFTGSEIWNDAYRCAEEVSTYVDEWIEPALKELRKNPTSGS